MKKLKFVVALIFASFCFFVNAESISSDLTIEKTTQNINVLMDIPEVTSVDTTLKDRNIDFFNFDSNINIIAQFHSLQALPPNSVYVGISDHPFYRLTSDTWILSKQLQDSTKKYKPPIRYQF